jgi:hypothetical protein
MIMRYLHSAIEKDQNLVLVSKILELLLKKHSNVEPRKFCRQWFGLELIDKNGKSYYTKEQIIAIESEHGYRERCIRLIAKILKIKANTIQRWGKGVKFDKIPLDKREQYEAYLGYVDSLRVVTMCLLELDKDLLVKLFRRLNNMYDEDW